MSRDLWRQGRQVDCSLMFSASVLVSSKSNTNLPFLYLLNHETHKVGVYVYESQDRGKMKQRLISFRSNSSTAEMDCKGGFQGCEENAIA